MYMNMSLISWAHVKNNDSLDSGVPIRHSFRFCHSGLWLWWWWWQWRWQQQQQRLKVTNNRDDDNGNGDNSSFRNAVSPSTANAGGEQGGGAESGAELGAGCIPHGPWAPDALPTTDLDAAPAAVHPAHPCPHWPPWLHFGQAMCPLRHWHPDLQDWPER